MDFTEFSIRYAIFCGVALAVVYLLVSLAGLVQIKLRRRSHERELKLDGEEVYWIKPEPGLADEEERVPEPGLATARSSQAAEQKQVQFGEQLFRSGVEAELQQLRS
ncbi:MAG: hypothetical protein NTY41_10520 [Proteobacteria bacterium]|nr:hypothetical protein [Pseudomonadota bacterium]